MPKFFCDYCDVYLTHDSMSVRKAHNNGRNHLRNVQAYYEQISSDQTQQVINSITDAYNTEGQANPLFQQNLTGAFPGGPMAMGGPMGMPGPPMGMPPAIGGMPPFLPPGMPPIGGLPPHLMGRGGPPNMPPNIPFPPGGPHSMPPGPGGLPPNMPPPFQHMGGAPPAGMPPFAFPPPGGAGSPPAGLPFPPPAGMPPGMPPGRYPPVPPGR